MFGKILRAGKGSHGLKYRIDVQITQLENLPTSIKKCRVVWARSAKMQITEVKDVRGSVASFKQTLTQVSTLYKEKGGKLEAKDYEFKVQVPGKSSNDALVTIGKANLDMAKYCSDETTTENAMLPITFKVGGTTTGYLKMVITTVFLGDANEDGLTEVSGMTGLTSDHGSIREQDLEGFGDEEHARFSKKAKSRRDDGASSSTGTSGRSSKPDARSSHRKPLPPMAEEDDSDLEDEPEPSPQPAKASRKKPQAAAQPPGDDAGGGVEHPFGKKVAARKPPPPKKWADVDDVSPLSSDVSDSETPRPASKGKPKEPELPLDDMKASLFATKKNAGSLGRSAAAAAGSASAAAASTGPSSKAAAAASRPGKASAPPPPDEDEDSLRNDLFSSKPAAAASKPAAATSKSAAAAGKPSKSSAPPPPPAEDEDEDSLRNDLFSAKPRGGAAAGAVKASGTKSAGGASGSGSADTSAGGARNKSRAPPPPQSDEEDDSDSDPSTSAAPPPATIRARGKAAEATEAAANTGSAAMARAGSAKPGASKAVSSAEVEQLRQRVARLEEQLTEEKVAKDDLNKTLQKYVDKIADLEDQLAEGNELYAQMKEMESKYQAEIQDLMEKHLAEVAETEERHRSEVAELKAELEEASSSGHGANGASAEELRRLEAELGAQETLLKSRTAKLEADCAAANAARQSAEAKLAEANKMIDDSLLVATKHQQENKGLHEEIARLKRQIEEVSMWDTGAAVAAATAATDKQRSDSEDDEEIEELREKVEELQEENARLQKLVSTRGRGSRAASDSEETYKKRIEELQAANRKLENVCDDLEEKSQVAQERADKLQAELQDGKERIRGLEAALASATAASAALQKRIEEEAAASNGRQAKDKTADLELRIARLGREKATLEEQLADERAARQELEETLKDKLERAGDDEAADTVAAFEVKYNRLKERYKMLEESSQEELDELQDQLTEAQSRGADLQRQVKQLQTQLAQNRSGGGGSANAEELRNLRSENERLVKQLVSKTMDLAELSEAEITMKRELARLREVNMKLAQKATTLEAQAAVAQAASKDSKPAKGAKK